MVMFSNSIFFFTFIFTIVYITCFWMKILSCLGSHENYFLDIGVAAVGNKLLALSGHDGANSFYHTVEEYNIEQDIWRVISSTVLPYGRCRFGCVALSLPKCQEDT